MVIFKKNKIIRNHRYSINYPVVKFNQNKNFTDLQNLLHEVEGIDTEMHEENGNLEKNAEE